MTNVRSRLEQNLGWFILIVLAAGCLYVMRPFVSALLWAAVLTFSTWPLYRRLLAVLGNRRTLAAALVSLGMILVILIPFVVVGATLADHVGSLTTAVRKWIDAGPPAPPEWLQKLPLIGNQVVEYWQSLAADSTKFLPIARRFIEIAGAWLLSLGVILGGGLVQLALSIFIAFFLFRDGGKVAEQLGMAVVRIGGDRGAYLLDLAGNTIRGVVYGILGTAMVQAVIAGIGFVIAGVPGAGVLMLLTFFLSVVPMGPPLVWIPAVFWLFHQGSTGWAIFMIVWGIGVSSIDNFVKPWLISRGSAMPFLLILFGVLGGAIAFGFIGVFLGPTLLAVGYRVVQEWFSSKSAAETETPATLEPRPGVSSPQMAPRLGEQIPGG
ncbi:MAG: AI-2E family transporter [Verrucomicrobia subdivision 3 bacterium]|nr:AI-2E family transporter [Limisphaerales bacterium]